ncbi:hypothetical protein ACSBR1_011561 [Camellia fascicularis]
MILLLFWQSFDFPADTILGNQTLYYGIELVSSVSSSSDHSSGRYRLKMQYNGNLIAYLVNCTDSLDAYWSFVLGMGEYFLKLNLNFNGLLYLGIIFPIYNTLWQKALPMTLFASNTSSIVSMEWSVMQDHCQVHGFCGFNSFCSRNSYEEDCYCYPGFVLLNPSKMFLGCYRNFTKQRCNSEEAFGLVNITSLENLWWGDHTYSVVPMQKKEDCGKYCLEDCNCAATLHFSRQCRKHKLPFEICSYTLTENKGHLISILAVSLGSLACLCIVIAGSSFFVYRHRVHKYKKLSDNAKLGLTTEEFSLRSFSYNELEEVIQGFKQELEEDGDSHREFRFQTEVTAIGRTHHRNLVRLLGFCVKGRRKLLVYEYMSNGSLANVLFKATDHQICLGWKERVRIVLDIAIGILYLHEECEACIVHCGIKPQNILMDDSWTAKISDFGLAKLLPNHMKSITGLSRGVTVTSGSVSSYLALE